MYMWRDDQFQPMHRAVTVLRASLFLTIGMMMALPLRAADGITTVRENGRTVYINSVSAQERAAAREYQRANTRYIYWSNTEHRWMTVPRPSPAALNAARSAAAEVASYVSSQPSGSGGRVSPGYRELANGHRVTSVEIDRAIEESAQKHNVDPNLVRALIKVESNFNSNAVSRKGAMGLMQLMPSTARSLNVKDPFDPAQNVDAGVRHLKELLENNKGDIPLTLAAYNAGQGAVKRNNGIPPYQETRDYVKKITRLYAGSDPNSRTFTNSAAPIRMTRSEDGTIRITNTDE